MMDLAGHWGNPAPLRPLVVDVDREGTATIAGMPIKDDGLQTLVGLLLRDDPRRRVRLRCDADLPFSRLADLLAALKTAGMPRDSVLLAKAPIPAARLDFRLAPVGWASSPSEQNAVANLPPSMPAKEGERSPLTEAQIKRYQEDLQANGPTCGQGAREAVRKVVESQNAFADLIGLLEGIEKASVVMQPASEGPNPPTLFTVAVQTRAGGPLSEELSEQVRDLMSAVAPGEVKVIEMTGAAADAKAKDASPADVDVAASDPCRWFELATEAPSSLITGTYRGRKQVLLMVRPEDAMAEDDEGPLRWRIADASLGKTAQGRPTLQVTLDGAGARRMAALSEAHRDEFLAVVIDGRVVCLRKIEAKMAAQIEIDGNFDAHQAQCVCCKGCWDRSPGAAKIQVLRPTRKTNCLHRRQAVVYFDYGVWHDPRNPDPIQLVWMVNEVEQLRASRVAKSRPHPACLDGESG